jgi:hypothetical protein
MGTGSFGYPSVKFFSLRAFSISAVSKYEIESATVDRVYSITRSFWDNGPVEIVFDDSHASVIHVTADGPLKLIAWLSKMKLAGATFHMKRQEKKDVTFEVQLSLHAKLITWFTEPVDSTFSRLPRNSVTATADMIRLLKDLEGVYNLQRTRSVIPNVG